MRKIILFTTCLLFAGAAGAADITLYYSPTCPHCHHAREFVGNELVYEYQTISAVAVNVMETANRPEFESTLKKCNFTSGGVPVIVIGEKCFQGYAASMNQELRDAASVGLSDTDKASALKNQKDFGENAQKFKSENTNRDNVITERGVAVQKKNNGTTAYFYGILILLIFGFGFIITRRKNK